MNYTFRIRVSVLIANEQRTRHSECVLASCFLHCTVRNAITHYKFIMQYVLIPCRHCVKAGKRTNCERICAASCRSHGTLFQIDLQRFASFFTIFYWRWCYL